MDEMTLFQMINPTTRNTVDSFRELLHKRYGDHAEAVFDLYKPQSDADVPEAMNRHATDLEMILPARKQAQWMAPMTSDCFLYHFKRIPRG